MEENYTQQNYSQQKQYQSYNRSETSTKALLALIFGILSYIVCPLIFGIVAWILGASELNDIKENRSAPENKSMALAGMWLGIVNVVLIVLSIIIIGILIMFFAFTIPYSYS